MAVVTVPAESEPTESKPTDAADRTVDLPYLGVTYDLTSSSPMELLTRLGDLCRIVWIVDAGDEALGPMRRLLTRAGTVFDTEGRPPAEVAAALVDARFEGHPLAGVIAFTDSQLVPAATIADVLGLPGNPMSAVTRLNDKYHQRQAMLDAGLAVPAFVRIPTGSDPAAGAALASGLRTPLVLKPLRGDSSRDVVAVADRAELQAALTVVATRDVTGDLIVEEYLADREPAANGRIGGYVSVESLVVDGEVIPVAITGKFPLAHPFRETGNFMPHPLDAAGASEVVDLSGAAARSLGVRSGALHTEIKLTPDGPRIIEVNGRIGGGAIDALYARRFGTSLTELAAAIALGIAPDAIAELPASADGPFLYEFFAQPPTTATALRAIGGLDAIVGVAGAESVSPNRSTGDALDWRNGSQGYVLRVSGTADDLAVLGSVPTAVLTAALIEYDED